MPKERGRRRRGRRRGRGEEQPPGKPTEERREEDLQISEESGAPGALPSRFTFWRRRRQDEGEEEKEAPREPPSRERPSERPAASGASPAGVSPLSFWRRGQTRPYRQQPLPRRGPKRLWRRLTGFYFPPWVPVVAIVVVVFGILGLLLFTRSATGAPRIGVDHWHATYEVLVCGERQPNFPFWQAGVHTHDDGLIHIHPNTPSEEGAGARLVRWFEYGGGKLTQDEMRMPGSREEFKNGDTCPDGSTAVLQVFVDDADPPSVFERLDNWSRYIPQDGDQVRIVFGPEEAVSEEGGAEISEEEATREISIEAGDRGSPSTDSFFDPNAFTIGSDETVKVNVTNTGTVTHNLRIEGVDNEYDTEDDFVTEPLLIRPGEEGFTVVRIPQASEYAFRCDIHPNVQFGTLTVEEGEVTATPAATEGSPEAVEVTLEVSLGDNLFGPNELEVVAGEPFRIVLVNDGTFVHNLRIAGPDGEYRTADDIVSETVNPGQEEVVLDGQIDEPGEYAFRDDFHPTEATGVITVK